MQKQVAFRGQQCRQIEFCKSMSKTHFHSNQHSSQSLHVDAIIFICKHISHQIPTNECIYMFS